MNQFRKDMLAAAQATAAVLPDGARFVIVALDMGKGGDLAIISNIPSVELSRELLLSAAEGEAKDMQKHVEGSA